jgi:hypothetical protein
VKPMVNVKLETELQCRVLYILHRGFVEARLLASADRNEQLFDLADAMEPLPGLVNEWSDEHMELIRFNLRNYQEKYGSRAFDYLALLNEHGAPERF